MKSFKEGLENSGIGGGSVAWPIWRQEVRDDGEGVYRREK